MTHVTHQRDGRQACQCPAEHRESRGSFRDLILSPKHRNPNSSHVSYFAQTRKTTPVILNLAECVERATTANFAAALIVRVLRVRSPSITSKDHIQLIGALTRGYAVEAPADPIDPKISRILKLGHHLRADGWR